MWNNYGARSAAPEAVRVHHDHLLSDCLLLSTCQIFVIDQVFVKLLNGYALPKTQARRCQVHALANALGSLLLDGFHCWQLSPRVLSSHYRNHRFIVKCLPHLEAGDAL